MKIKKKICSTKKNRNNLTILIKTKQRIEKKKANRMLPAYN